MDRKKKLVTIFAGIMAAVMILSLLLSLFASVTAGALSSSEIQNQIDQLKENQAAVNAQLKDLEKNLTANTNDLKDMVARKDGIDQQVALLHAQVQIVNEQISAFNLMIADKQEELDKSEEHLQELSRQYKARLRAMEEQGDLNYWAVIFQASSFADLLDRLNMVLEIANSDRQRLENLKAAAAEVEVARENLAVEKLALEQTKQELENSQVELAAKRAESDELLKNMVLKGEEYEKLIYESEKAQYDLMQEIAKKNEEYDDAKYKEWLATSTPPTTTAPAPTSAPRPDGIVWYHPLGHRWYRVTDRFGMRIHPILNQWLPHDGIDLAAVAMTPILATRAGVVTIAGWDNSAGNYVSINHGDGYSSIYMHQTYYIVEVGQFVSAGQVIGYLGTTGGSTGNHLHFGIAYNGKWEDPELHIDF